MSLASAYYTGVRKEKIKSKKYDVKLGSIKGKLFEVVNQTKEFFIIIVHKIIYLMEIAHIAL